ncbi:MAG: hypothetical protein U0353_08645 [Sandaracinus sp.]
MLSRRALTLGALGTLAVGGVTSSAEARCAPISIAQEIERARYVVEVEPISVDSHGAVLRVIASWKGTPPATITVSFSGRGHPLRNARPGTVLVVFAQGPSDAHLLVYPCGATGVLDRATIDALTHEGLTRTAR